MSDYENDVDPDADFGDDFEDVEEEQEAEVEADEQIADGDDQEEHEQNIFNRKPSDCEDEEDEEEAILNCDEFEQDTQDLVSPTPSRGANLDKYSCKKTHIQMTKYERAKILGQRAEQIAHGAPSLISTREHDALKIAEAELDQGLLEFIVRRPLSKTNFEDCLSNRLV